MTRIKFYDSIGCIGGNKIAVESDNKSVILLDFGFNFGLADKFIDSPFLNLRENRILIDAFKSGFLPPSKDIIQGIYRDDLYQFYKEELEQLYNIDLSLPPKVTHVLISHGHSDHIGHIKYLHESIQPVCGPITKVVLDYYEEIYNENSNFRGVIQYSPKFQLTDRGYRDRRGRTKISRNLFTIENYQFVQLPKNDDFLVAFYPTDHSLVGAGAYFIFDKQSKKKIIYSGDLRLHGPKADRVKHFIAKAKDFNPDVFIVEGTRIDSEVENELKGEAVVEKEITTYLHSIKLTDPTAPVFFECSRTDLFRFQSFYQAASKVSRKLVINPRTYYLLKKCLEANVEGLNRINIEDIGIYLPRKGWMVYDTQDYTLNQTIKNCFPDANSLKNFNIEQNHAIRAHDISEHPEKYLLYLDLFSIVELCDINPPSNMHYILSKSEWDDPKSKLYEAKKKNWLKLFNFNEKNLFKVHCSGHIAPNHLVEMINTIKPQKVFPIHTLKPEKFFELNLDKEIEIILPKKGISYEI